jgi:hypothetical protein
MAAKTGRVQLRVEPETRDKIEQLGRLWGPVQALTPSAVVRRCVELIHRAEVEKPAPAGRRRS